MADKGGNTFVSRQNIQGKSPSQWLQALKSALEEVKEKSPDSAIEAICVSGNGPTLVAEDFTSLFYKESFPNIEVNVSSECKKALKESRSLFIPRLALFKSLYPESWEKSSHIYSGPEFFIHLLTGESLTILPQESFAPAYWSREELKKCGFTENDIKKLPPFKAPSSFAGKISEEAALATGLFEGTFVFCGAPDFIVALIGTGTVFPGRLCDRAGSSEGLNLCTSQPVFAPNLRTLPSVIPGLWNLSYLINMENTNSGDKNDLIGKNDLISNNDLIHSDSYFSELKKGISLLKSAALSAGEDFPDFMASCGGQTLNKELVAAKEKACGIKIKVPYCADAELIGDLILARVGLGDADDILEGVFSYIPQF